METKWTAEVAEDLQVLASMAALAPITHPTPAGMVVVGKVTSPLEQQSQLRQLTLAAYEGWAATYPGAADALERSLERVEVHEEMGQRNPVEVMPDDWVDDETLPLLYGQAPSPPWRPPVVQVEEYLAWSWPRLTGALGRCFRSWPKNAPLMA